MTQRQYEATCECGIRWPVYRDEDDDDRTSTCIECGAETIDLGEIDAARSGSRNTPV
jgi:hypothetical protein